MQSLPPESGLSAEMPQKTRNVLFLGNCQAAALADAYTEWIAPGRGDAVSFVASIWPVSAEDRALVAQADVVVEQVFDFKQHIGADAAGSGARVVRFPTVGCGFLWPFAGGAVPARAGQLWPEGTYFGPDLNDRFLNRMIADGTPAEAAVARYLALDAEQMALDKRLDFVLGQQRRRDDAAGSRIAEDIAAHFRDEPLFFGPYQPGARILRLLMADLLGKLGAERVASGYMDAIISRSQFESNWLPIHPAVAAHFGLTYVAEGQRYPTLQGSFSFAEWAGRYMRLAFTALPAAEVAPATGPDRAHAEAGAVAGSARAAAPLRPRRHASAVPGAAAEILAHANLKG